MADFDPYHRWLQILASEQPANHYRLLALTLYEADPDVIENAASQRLTHLRSFQTGPNVALSQKLMNEVTQAKLVLLVPEKKIAYDAQLRADIETQEAAEAAAANPFTQLKTGDPKPNMPRTKIQIPAELSVPASAAPSSASSFSGTTPVAPLGNPAVRNVARPPAASVIKRPAKKQPPWILPAAIGGSLLVLLIVVGAVVIISMSGKRDTGPIAESKVNETTETKPAVQPNGKNNTSTIDPKQSTPNTVPEVRSEDATGNKPANLLPTATAIDNKPTNPNLLSLVKLPDALRSGQAELTDSGLLLKRNPSINLVEFPQPFPAEYDLYASLTGTGDPVSIGFPVDGQPVSLLIDGYAVPELDKLTYRRVRAGLLRQFEAEENFHAAFKDWEVAIQKELAARDAVEFHDVEIVKIETDHSVEFQKQDDGSYLATGPNPPSCEYRVLLKTNVKKITGIRLEVLADSSLPSGGPGRTSNGNFALNQIVVRAADKAAVPEDARIKFSRAEADFSQDNQDVQSAIDGRADRGWAVLPHVNKDHWAIFFTENPITNRGLTWMQVTFDQHFGSEHTMGRFRLSVMTGNEVVPHAISLILAVKSDKRTFEQRQSLREYFVTIYEPTSKLLNSFYKIHQAPIEGRSDAKRVTCIQTGSQLVLQRQGVPKPPPANFKLPNGPLKTKYVRVQQLIDLQYLHLAEVQVFAGGKNIALDGKATLSSVYQTCIAQRGIDGNTAGDDWGTVAHTDKEHDGWWEVELATAASLEQIVIWNRNDYQDQLSHFRVILFDEDHQPIWIEEVEQTIPQSLSIEVPADTSQFSDALKESLSDYVSETEWTENAHEGQVLDRTKTDLRISVRKGSVTLSKNDEVLYTWKRTSKRETPPQIYETAQPYNLRPNVATFQNAECTVNYFGLVGPETSVVSVIPKTETKPDEPKRELPTTRIRELNGQEKLEWAEVKKAVAAAKSALNERDFDKAKTIIANAESIATYDETEQVVAALKIVASDIEAFWILVKDQCGRLNAAHEIEFADNVAIVVESSEEQISLRYKGQAIRKAPLELPTGLAMAIVESAMPDPTDEFLREKGSVYFVDSIENKENLAKASQIWNDLNANNYDIGPLMMLIATE